MAHQRVGPRRYDFLARAEFDECRGKSVFLEYEKYDEEPKRDQDISACDYIRRHRGPCATMIESGDKHNRDEIYHRQRLNDLLALLLLVEGARGYPPLEQVRIVLHQVDGDRQHRHEKYGQENPRLPIMERPRRDEQQRCHDDKQLEKSSERLFVHVVHLLILGDRIVAFCARHFSISAGSSLCRNSKKASVSAIRAPAGVSRPTTSIPSRRLCSHRSSTWSLRAIASYQTSLCTR